MATAERLIDVFNEAKLRPTEAERHQFVVDACGNDAELKQQVLSLLEAHERAANFLQPAPLFSSTALITEKPGDRIGRYKLLQKIGEGGCGVVYMAEQEEPVRRRVALKVIKLGMDTKSVIARFEAERQALALMDHPNIAKVLDAGATETGRPFFVMELVRGIRITEYCDQNNLSTGQRLELFAQVCHAVQHAHQKGIIHRDIKPSNILVTVIEPGCQGLPKVIDFGIAKATTGERLTDKPVFTAFEQFIGTPAYMSPEQAMMTTLDIDTRTDIYALGVLLYELLTGRTPFDAMELMAAGFDAMRRIIHEQEPACPSTRLSTMLEAESTQIAKHRQSEPGKLGNLLRGDLDWIVMKCLEKDRARRYETANGLAADLRRHLQNEPVTARPPSRMYQLQKLIRRNKTVFATSAAVAAALIIGVVISTLQAVRATRAEREQSRLRNQSEHARIEAETARNNAVSEAAKSAQVAAFLKSMLKGVGPSVAVGRDTAMLKEILDKTAARVGADLGGQPEVEADLRTIIGSVYRELGEFKKAESMDREALVIRRRLGRMHLEIADSLVSLGQDLREQRKFAEAETVQREALAIRRDVLGDEHLSVADSLNKVGNELRAQDSLPEAEVLQRQALAMQRKLLGNEDLEVADTLTSLALTVVRLGQAAEGEQLHREALAIRRKFFGHDHLDVASSLDRVAATLMLQHKPAEAAELYRESIAIRRKLEPEHPFLARSLANLADLTDQEDGLDAAEAMYREAMGILRKRFGGAHPDTAEVAQRFGTLLCQQGKFAEAEVLFRDGILQAEKTSAGPDELDYWLQVCRLHNGLGILLRNSGKESESQLELQKAADLWRAHPQSVLIESAKRVAEAEPNNIHHWHRLGQNYLGGGQWQQALDAFEVCVRLGSSAHQWFPMAIAHGQLGDKEEARKWFEKGLDWMDTYQEVRLRRDQTDAALTLGSLNPWARSHKASQQFKQGDAFRERGATEEAQKAYAEATEIYKTLATDFPNVPAYTNRLSRLSRRTHTIGGGKSGTPRTVLPR